MLKVYVIWNIFTFLIMGLDKYKAKHDKWRISENVLLFTAFAFGGMGALIGSQVFRHKTQKMKFKLLLPLSVLVNWAAIYLIVKISTGTLIG